MMQRYVAQPNEDGTYEVARFNDITEQYEHVETCLSEEDAKELAHDLNEQEKQYEFEHQNDLIDRYHGYAVSDDIQKNNAAREFFSHFPYQRDVCDEILSELNKKG